MISNLKSDDCNYITEQILKRLTSVSSNSRKILNILNLIDFLLKNGSSKFKGEIEEERFYLRKMKDNFNDAYDILHKPIQNIISNIVELLQNPEKLQKEREDAKKIRERIKGVSNETPVKQNDQQYQGYSSDNIENDSYDIKPEINLKKKLGFEVEEKHTEEKVEVQNDVVLESKNEQQEIDFLGDVEQEKTQVNQPIQETKPKKKIFLPPPPKKNNNKAKKYHKQPSNKADQKQNDLIQINSNQQQNNQGLEEVQHIQQDLIDLNFLDDNAQQNNNNLEQKETKKNQELKTENKQQEDMFDFSNFDLKQEKKENQMDNYLNFLQNTNANKLPQPPKKINNNPQNKYDFF